MPSGCAAAVFLYGSSLSQGKAGNRSETADTGTGSLSGTANASAPYGDRDDDQAVRDRGGTSVRGRSRGGYACGGSAAMTGWSRSIRPSLLAPPGEPSVSKKPTLAV